LSPDRQTLYFSSDRTVPVHFPRTREQTEQDIERAQTWDNGNYNVWFMPIAPWLTSAKSSDSLQK
jgi:WD40-like Beta Propeller Repeat